MQKRYIKLLIIVAVVLAVLFGVTAFVNRPTATQSAAKTILNKINDKDYTGSYALTSKDLKKITTPEAWKQFVDKESAKLKNGFSYSSESNIEGSYFTVLNETKTSPYKYIATVGLVKEDGKWTASYVSTSIKPLTTKTETSK